MTKQASHGREVAAPVVAYLEPPQTLQTEMTTRGSSSPSRWPQSPSHGVRAQEVELDAATGDFLQIRAALGARLAM